MSRRANTSSVHAKQERVEYLDIADGVMSAIYSHREPAEKLGDRVPPRKAPPRAPGDEYARVARCNRMLTASRGFTAYLNGGA
jgi:hypothetical protein